MDPGRTIRILQVIAEDRTGGPHTIISNVAKALRPLGIETVVAMPEGTGDFADRLSQDGVPFYRIRGMLRPRGALQPAHNMAWLAYLLTSVGALRRIIENGNIDVVHQNHPFHVQGAIAARLAKRKVVWHIHGYGHPRLAKIFRPIVSHLADQVVAASEYTGMAFMRNGRDAQSTSGFEVLYPPIDVDAYSAIGPNPQLKAQFGFGQSDPVIGIVGHINPLKGHLYFVKAASLIKRSVPEARFLVIGGNFEYQRHYWRRLQEETRHLGLERDLVFTGPRSDIAELLTTIDIVVNSSLTEGLSLALGEALAARKPVVATAVGGTPEIIRDGVTGRLVPPKDPQAIATAVVDLLNDPDTAAALAANGRELVRQTFSLERSAHRYVEIYRKVLEAGNHDSH